MHSVESIAAEIVRREGGYVNDPDDPGGATNHGVTIHTMRRLGLDLNSDGLIDPTDVKLLDRDKAVAIYIEHYFRRPKIGTLPAALHASVFDMQVNAGSNAVRILQRLLTEFGRSLKDDGAIGPKTARAAQEVMETAPDHLPDAYGIARRNYYYRIGDSRKASRKYARRRDGGKGGWIVRAEEFISERFHLSDAQHAARIASWG